MLDIKLIRDDPELVKAAMKTRNKDMDATVDMVLEIDAQRRELMRVTDSMKQEQNAASKEIPRIKKEGGDIAPIMARMNEIKEKIKKNDAAISELDANQKKLMYEFPNVPNSIPPTTQTPMVRLPLAPAPVANISGSIPKIMVSEVIRMGRNRSFALRNAAFTMDKPFCRPCEAYSVIRMAVLANKPTNIIRPICI